MTPRPRLSAWLGAAQGEGESWYVVEVGQVDDRDEWNAETLEGECDGDAAEAARAGLLAALATLTRPSRLGVAVTDAQIANQLRSLVRVTEATSPHMVSITCVSQAAVYAAMAVECLERARRLAGLDCPSASRGS